MNTTHDAPPTVIEQVTPVQGRADSRLDAWRWVGVLGFDDYRAVVLQREAARASRNV